MSSAISFSMEWMDRLQISQTILCHRRAILCHRRAQISFRFLKLHPPDDRLQFLGASPKV